MPNELVEPTVQCDSARGVRITRLFANVPGQGLLEMAKDFESCGGAFRIDVSGSGHCPGATPALVEINVFLNGNFLDKTQLWHHEQNRNLTLPTISILLPAGSVAAGPRHTLVLRGSPDCRFDGNDRINVTLTEYVGIGAVIE